ncbi:MAG: hypothetical protein ACKV0T_14230 [Planctomycetales bacterium]
MDSILRGYSLNDPTWLYLSFVLILAVYFKFSRLWSVRNLDLLLLLSLSPGLYLVGRDQPDLAAFGYVWLFGATALLLVRVLYDGIMTRRPRLEQNMNAAGMTFLCAATLLLLTARLLTEDPPPSTVESIRKANALLDGSPLEEVTAPEEVADATDKPARDAVPAGPGTSLATAAVSQLSKAVTQHEPGEKPSRMDLDLVTARLTAIVAHIIVILGLVLIGRHIFQDSDLGFAMAALYMLLPCTAFDVGKINHVLPAAFVVWAIWAYRRPFLSGTLLGLACAMMFFPIFLLPLWLAFYGRRGGVRFGAAVLLTTAAIISSLVVMSGDSRTFLAELLVYVDWPDLGFRTGSTLRGFWEGHEAYRIPVFVAYLVMLVALTIWPHRKSLAHVIPSSAALVIGTQFWYPQEGGVYVLWYLPLLILVVFRPMMSNHFAPELRPLWFIEALAGKERKRPELVGSASSSEGSSFR